MTGADTLELGGFGERALSVLAHRLRTPLSVVVGYAELLVHRDDEETRREAPARILEAAELLSGIVDDLLTVMAIESGTMYLDAEPLDLGAVVEEALAQLRAKGGTRRLVADDGDWPVVRADPGHLQRIVRNVVLDACRRAPEGGEVRVSVAREPGFAAASVSGQGAGLTGEELETVFEPSSGIELYAVRRLVELQGGSVSAASEPGRGTTVTFTLPLATS